MIRSRGFAAGLAAAAALSAATPSFAGYEQASAPLKTPWGEKVTPQNAWREYPRPQMVRAQWTNLNGLWQYAVTKDAPGCPANWDGRILVPFVIESALSGVGRPLEKDDTLWYRRSFDAEGRDALVAGRLEKIPALVNANFDLRDRIFNVAEENRRMVMTARSAGASAKFAGSGGAIVGTYEDDAQYAALSASLAALGCRTIKPVIASKADELGDIDSAAVWRNS